MTNKMAATDLFDEQGLPIYGDSKRKVEKDDEEDGLSSFKPAMWQRILWYHFQQELMVNKKLVHILDSLIICFMQ